MNTPHALIIDDDGEFRASLALLVEREKFSVRCVGTLAVARAELERAPADVCLLDLSLPDGDGLAWLREEPTPFGGEVIVVTGHASVDSAIESLQRGALDYLTKPIDRARLRTALINVARTRALKQEVGSLRGESRWMVSATSSLPVPLSPMISTVASSGATRATRS